MIKMLSKKKKGFTLTELIVVIAILGVLAAVVTPSVLGYLSDAKSNADATNLSTLDSCVKRLAAKGVFDTYLTATNIGDNKAAIIAEIQKEVTTIPTPNDTTNKYWLLTRVASGGKLISVTVTQVAASTETNDTIILNTAAPTPAS